MNTIITISREYGSGGRFVGKLLADELGIPFYDKEIIVMASEDSGFAQEFIKENEQKMKGLSSVAFTAGMWGGNLVSNFENVESKIYACEAGAIEENRKTRRVRHRRSLRRLRAQRQVQMPQRVYPRGYAVEGGAHNKSVQAHRRPKESRAHD